jgi:hypothetical protein
MAERPDKLQRKERIDRWRADQRAAARAKLPLPNDRMQELFDALDSDVPRSGCDHTLRLTQAWLHRKNIAPEPVLEWLRENGGYCDCEALANAEQAWREAISDVDW